jgi:hypothetical protein
VWWLTATLACIDQAQAADYDLLTLRIPGLLVEAFWLKSRSGNTDLGVSRAFPLPFGEGLRILFHTEFFNLFNRPQLGLPNATIREPNFWPNHLDGQPAAHSAVESESGILGPSATSWP